jgi:hypothetical protein
MQSFEATLIVDGQGVTRVDRPLALTPGRHRALVTINEDEESVSASTEPWSDFLTRTYGSLADRDFVRHPQGTYEQRDEIA